MPSWRDGMKEVRRTTTSRHWVRPTRIAMTSCRSTSTIWARSSTSIRFGGASPSWEPIPLGGASVAYWGRIAEKYGLNMDVVDTTVDPTFRFMHVDWDGKIRMDCSSPYAMAGLIALRDKFRLRSPAIPMPIVTAWWRASGLLNPNHYLAVAINYLFRNRPGWSRQRWSRQDAGQQQHDQPRRQEPGTQAGGSSGGLQVVCGRTARRLAGLRRRRERGRIVPAARRHGVDHRQRRPHHGTAGGGDVVAHRQRSRASCMPS